MRPHPSLERLMRAARSIDGSELVVVANREPYVHERSGDGGIVVRRPPGGLVTGIEPLLRTCRGTWIAHGSGSADAATVDGHGVVAVPPEDPRYALRRIFLSESEVEHYYCGFANEALWPLCHMAHEKPRFRQADWKAYRDVNRRFAEAAAAKGNEAVVLVQDYHFALVPRMLRTLAPRAVTGLFWHVPWPNADIFSICPWKEDLLDGLLGADFLGFHTDEYGANFLEAAARFVPGARIRGNSIDLHGHRTEVRTYPISIEWPYPAATRAEGQRLRRELGIAVGTHVCVGVERADYTKGLLERIEAVEVMLERHPSLHGRYVLVQLAAPSRQQIGRYRTLIDEVREAAARVNARFGTDSWQPVLLRVESFAPEEVRRYYAMADSALVTPLHDGMNLVAKEYIAACTDDRGALVLSRFAGAAKELRDALIVNPYDAVETAEAIRRAVEMPETERMRRMRALRATVEGNTIYDWSAGLLTDLARVRTARRAKTDEPAPLLHVRHSIG